MNVKGQGDLQKPKSESNNHKNLVSPPPLVLKASRYLPVLIFLGLAVHLILPQIASFEESLQVIRTMVLWAVLLAAFAQIMSYVGTGYLLYSVVAIVNQHLSVFMGALINLAATSMGMVAGGTLGNAAATYRWVRRSGISAEGSGLAGTLPTIFNNAILTVLAVAGMIYLMLVHGLSSLQFFTFLLILTLMGLGLAAVSWGKHHRDRFASAAVRIASSFAHLLKNPYTPDATEALVSRMFAAFDTLGNGGWKRPLLGSTLSTGFDMLTLYFFFIAAGHPVKLSVLLVGYGLPLLFGKMAFIIPGGVGVVESTMAALYTGLGVPGPITVVVILGYRMFSFWIPTLVGFPIAFYLQKK